ncbi:MAG: hypothetical protein R6X33_17015 [Candidatus Brocadiia bacterium]
MNALTKVLVVLVLVLSIGFAAAQVVLFQKREDFGAQYREAAEQLTSARGELDDVKGQLADKTAQLERLRASSDEQIQSLQDELEQQKARARELNANLEQLQTNVGELTQVVNKQETRIESLSDTNDDLKNRISELQSTINDKEGTINQMQDTIGEKDGAIADLRHQLNGVKEERTELAESNARLNGIVQEFRQRGFEVPPAPAPAIDAMVVRVNNETGTAVIDKGSQNEVKPNTQFTVYDDEGFVATLVIHDVWDTVAGGMVTRSAAGRQIAVGDRATTEIQVR